MAKLKALGSECLWGNPPSSGTHLKTRVMFQAKRCWGFPDWCTFDVLYSGVIRMIAFNRTFNFEIIRLQGLTNKILQ